jgi:hypothetical protein
MVLLAQGKYITQKDLDKRLAKLREHSFRPNLIQTFSPRGFGDRVRNAFSSSLK